MATVRFFQRYRLLAEAHQQLAGAATFGDVLEVLRSHARVIADADGVAVVRRNGSFVDYVGEDAIAPLWTGQTFPIERCVSGLAMLQREAIAIPDIAQDARVPLSAYLATFVRSMAVFPLGMPAPSAALGLYWRDVRSLDEDVASLMGLLAQGANLAFQRLAIVAERVA